MLALRHIKGSLKQLLAITTALSLAVAAKAQIFTGSINFLGNATLDAPLGSATGFTGLSGFVSGGQTGDFTSVPNYVPVTFTPFTFSPAPSTAFPLLNFTANSANYSFEVTSVSMSQTSSALNLMGNGYILAFGSSLSYSPATWTLDIKGVSKTSPTMATFGASINAVPEPSVFVLLLIGVVFFGGRMLVKRHQAFVLARVRSK